MTAKKTHRRLTGAELLARMQRFLEDNHDLRPSLKITSNTGKRASVFMIRCMMLEHFLDVLAEDGILGDIKNSHDSISLFLHATLDARERLAINQRDDGGIEIDVLLRGYRSEIKTRRNIDANGVPDFVSDWFDAMIDDQGDKEAWWLVHFVQRDDAKDKIGDTCMYYLVAIEIPTRDIEESDLKPIIEEIRKLSQQIEKKVRNEDDMKDAFFLPVDNIVPVDRLRKKVEKYQQERDQSRHDLDQARQKIKELQDELDRVKKSRA